MIHVHEKEIKGVFQQYFNIPPLRRRGSFNPEQWNAILSSLLPQQAFTKRDVCTAAGVAAYGHVIQPYVDAYLRQHPETPLPMSADLIDRIREVAIRGTFGKFQQQGAIEGVEGSKPLPDSFCQNSRGTWMATIRDSTVELWDFDNGQQLCALAGFHNRTGPGPSVDYVGLSPNRERIFTAGKSGTIGKDPVKIWDVKTARCLLTLPQCFGRVVFSSHSTRIVACRETQKVIEVWDIGARERLLEYPADRIEAVTSDGSRFCTTKRKRNRDEKTVVQVCDIVGARKRLLEYLADKILADRIEDVTSDGSRFCTTKQKCDRDGETVVQVWDSETVECLREFSFRRVVRDITLSPDGMKMAIFVHVAFGVDENDVFSDCGGNPQQGPHPIGETFSQFPRYHQIDFWIEVFDLQTGQLLIQWQEQQTCSCKTFSTDGTKVAVGVERGVSIYDINEKVRSFLPDESYEDFVVFSPSGGRIVIAPEDEAAVRVWDVQRKKCLQALPADRPPSLEEFRNIAFFSSDGTKIFTFEGPLGKSKVWRSVFPPETSGISELNV